MKKLLAMSMGFVLSFSMLTGCATLFGGGGNQLMTFDSAPQGAQVILNGVQVGVTPLVMSVPRQSNAVVTFKKDGYDSQNYVLEHRLNPWFWGDVVALSLLSTTVDFATDSTVEYAPNRYFATLNKTPDQGAATPANDKRMQISQFVVTNYAVLGQELSVGGAKAPGEHVSTLIDLLGVNNTDKKATMLVLQDLYRDSKSAPDFSNAVLAKFGLQ